MITELLGGGFTLELGGIIVSMVTGVEGDGCPEDPDGVIELMTAEELWTS